MEFFRQDYWIGLSFPPPGDLPDPGIGPVSPRLQADSLPAEPLVSKGPGVAREGGCGQGGEAGIREPGTQTPQFCQDQS